MNQDAAPPAVTELPVEGYPVAAEAVTEWFRRRHGRLPTEQELGAIMLAMAQRETTPPVREAPHLDGWTAYEGIPAATRR